MKRLEVDQSGRIEDLSTGTAIAYSNDSKRAIFIAAGVKRIIVRHLKVAPTKSHDFAPLLFATLTFILLRGNKNPKILIDEEYTGKESLIENTISKLFKQSRGKISYIQFGNIGKSSPAHKLAWQTHRQKGKGKIRKISVEEISRLLKE